jgi:N-acetylglutamate synthase-like GNAT family acetyltransferase
MRVRDYTPADRNGCLAVFDSNVPKFFVPAERPEFAAFLDALPGPYIVLEEDDGTIVGCGGHAVTPATGVADLCWGMVLQTLHGTGLGERLTLARMDRVRADPAARVVALSTSQLTTGFYERHGFVITRVVPDGFAPGLDQCEMRLALDPAQRESPAPS